MKPSEVMHAYNQHERKDAKFSGFSKVESPHLVKFISQHGPGSFVSFHCFSADEANERVANEIAAFSRLGQPFEWKTYSTDHPADLGATLLAHGFTREASESFMVLSLETVEASQPVPDCVVEVSNIDGIRDAIQVQEQVWGGDLSHQLSHLIQAKQQTPDDITIYVVYEQSRPVSSAWIVYRDESPFASIWGGSTLAAFRGRGYYSALLHQRINDAKRRGKQFLTIDASDMSRPIVEKHGFQLIATTTPYIYCLR
ncbi:GNAT family N-acetyltransferase [Photobacterium atrarenae]|uniref:GNAT family N-acetyltransferase n=1 Tax=Photobacterium atrarenae TaxID=865757 RepID=A0ABY5GK04_9GAMM|nr:GNAT family N-acetyltransferase [Photobacterium atrarenae]UTV29034.1 GNAT family N-acetyltransferase [Photobacterium atrarenae]